MSNFAEFDVPEQTNQSEIEKQETSNNKPEAKTTKKTAKQSKNIPPKIISPSLIFTVLGYITLIPAITATTNFWFKTQITLPYQTQIAPYTLLFIIASYIIFKLLSRKNPLAKLGLLLVYITTAAFIIYKIYDFITTGSISWA